MYSQKSIVHFIAFIEDVNILQIILSIWVVGNPKSRSARGNGNSNNRIDDDQYAQIPFDDHWCNEIRNWRAA